MLINDRTFKNLKRNVDRSLNAARSSILDNDILGRATAPLLLDISELEMLNNILDNAPYKMVDDSRFYTGKTPCIIILYREGFADVAYYQKDGTFSSSIDCKIFNNNEEAEKALQKNNFKDLALKFCKENNWTFKGVAIHPCPYSLESFVHSVKLSYLDLEFLACVLSSAWGLTRSYNADVNPFFLQSLRHITEEFMTLFTTFIPEVVDPLKTVMC